MEFALVQLFASNAVKEKIAEIHAVSFMEAEEAFNNFNGFPLRACPCFGIPATKGSILNIFELLQFFSQKITDLFSVQYSVSV